MDRQDLKERVELVSRIGGILIVLLYGAGFLIVSFQNASYGVVEFGLFRTRLLSAGILFSIFLGLPLLEAARAFGLLGFQAWMPIQNQANGTSKSLFYYTRAAQILNFFISSWVIAFFMRTFFGDLDLSLSFNVLYVAFIGIATAVLMIIKKYFWRNPGGCALLALVTISIGFAELTIFKKWQAVLLLLWFLFVGSFTHHIDSPITDRRQLRHLNWHLVVFNTIGVFAFFALAFYPKIGPAFGGGSPVALEILALADSTDGTWQGTAGELLAELTNRVPEELRRDRSWPKTPKAMSNALAWVSPNFAAMGMIIERLPREPHTGRRLYKVRKVPSPPSPTVTGMCCQPLTADAQGAGSSSTVT